MSQNDVCADVTMSDPSRVEKDSGRYLERSVWGKGIAMEHLIDCDKTQESKGKKESNLKLQEKQKAEQKETVTDYC